MTPELVLITGMSGAGRSGAAAVLEDLGWYVIDNLPTSLVDTIVELVSKPGSDIERLFGRCLPRTSRIELKEPLSIIIFVAGSAAKEADACALKQT